MCRVVLRLFADRKAGLACLNNAGSKPAFIPDLQACLMPGLMLDQNRGVSYG